ncbi:hypothetical protein [Streptomyces cucumeris]|uniref:hypothetical protein n=1 Tax=Streptomyces cucumeris TaxID=2962890 RepID=UPI003D733CA9
MTLPARHRRGRLSERPFPGLGWDRPLAAGFEAELPGVNARTSISRSPTGN